MTYQTLKIPLYLPSPSPSVIWQVIGTYVRYKYCVPHDRIRQYVYPVVPGYGWSLHRLYHVSCGCNSKSLRLWFIDLFVGLVVCPNAPRKNRKGSVICYLRPKLRRGILSWHSDVRRISSTFFKTVILIFPGIFPGLRDGMIQYSLKKRFKDVMNP